MISGSGGAKKDDSLIEGLVQVILSLKPAQRRRLIDKLIDRHVLSEDDEDRMIIEMRKDEPTIPYSKIKARMKRRQK
jgi:hypothetical protein